MSKWIDCDHTCEPGTVCIYCLKQVEAERDRYYHAIKRYSDAVQACDTAQVITPRMFQERAEAHEAVLMTLQK